jgi:hypothetical protein
MTFLFRNKVNCQCTQNAKTAIRNLLSSEANADVMTGDQVIKQDLRNKLSYQELFSSLWIFVQSTLKTPDNNNQFFYTCFASCAFQSKMVLLM